MSKSFGFVYWFALVVHGVVYGFGFAVVDGCGFYGYGLVGDGVVYSFALVTVLFIA